MQPESRDPAYLWDMLDAARSIQDFISSVSFEQYMQNRMMQLAVERQLEIIGEAARRVSDGFKNKYPEIPWGRIIGLRNVLAHEYGDIQHERLWLVITDDLPKLIELLEPLIPPLPSDK